MIKLPSISLTQAPLHTALRGACATVAGIILCRLLHIEFGYWVLFSIIIVMQTNLGASIRKAKQRILGTIFGVLLGALFTVLLHGHLAGLWVAVALLIMLTIYSIPFSYTLAIFFGSILLITLLGQNTTNIWQFIIDRIVDTILGASIALLASTFLWPTWARFDFCDVIIAGIESCSTFLTDSLQQLLHHNVSEDKLAADNIEVEQLLNKTRQYYDDLSHEPSSLTVTEGALYSIVSAQERMHSLLLGLRVIEIDKGCLQINKELQQAFAEFLLQNSQVSAGLCNTLKNRTPLPSFLNLSAALQQLEKIICNLNPAQVKNYAVLAFLQRIFSNYVNELRHISFAIKQARNMI